MANAAASGGKASPQDDCAGRLLLVEEVLWQCVNRERWLVYQRAWKDFYKAVYPERYYEILARDLGEDKPRWARLPYAERMRELAWYHAHFNTPDDLSPWPAELDGGVDRGCKAANRVEWLLTRPHGRIMTPSVSPRRIQSL